LKLPCRIYVTTEFHAQIRFAADHDSNPQNSQSTDFGPHYVLPPVLVL
jgi:hypothetical protein